MMAAYIQKKKSCPSESSTPSSPSPMAGNYMHNNNNVPQQNGMNGNGTMNGQNPSETPSPGLNNNNAPKYGTPVPNRIFVGGISAQTTESELAQLFSTYGNVKATKIIVDRAGVSKGYGFVTFETELEARRIMRDAQCVVFKQRKLNIAPAIKKQPFSRSLEVQSPPIGIQSAVLYANGAPYMYHNGMAFFSPPEPSTNFPPAAAPATSQIATVPAPAAAVCPTMMYPCPPGQPIYQYPYQHLPGHIFRGGHPPMGYFMTSPHVMSHEGPAAPTHQHLYYMDGQLMQICEPPMSDLPLGPILVPTFPVARATAAAAAAAAAAEVDEGGDRDRSEGGSGGAVADSQTATPSVLLLDIGRDAPAAKIPRSH